MDKQSSIFKEKIESTLKQWPVIESYEIKENSNWQYCYDLKIKFENRIPIRSSIQCVFNGWVISETSKNPFYRSIGNGIKQLVKDQI